MSTPWRVDTALFDAGIGGSVLAIHYVGFEALSVDVVALVGRVHTRQSMHSQTISEC